MVPIKNLRFDCYLNRFKARNQKQFSDFLARQIAHVCHTDGDKVSGLLTDSLEHSEKVFVDGVSVIDVQSDIIAQPALVIGTLDEPLSIPAVGNKPVDIVVGVLSTPACGAATHLQKLAKVSRLLRSEDFCEELRSCQSVDSMEVLFMPSDKLVKAA